MNHRKNPSSKCLRDTLTFSLTETGWTPLSMTLIKTIFPKKEQKQTHKNMVHSQKRKENSEFNAIECIKSIFYETSLGHYFSN
jgi:hypothetical protein